MKNIYSLKTKWVKKLIRGLNMKNNYSLETKEYVIPY